MDDLDNKIQDPGHHVVSGRLTPEIMDHAGARNPFELSGAEFNLAAEKFYRTRLRRQHLADSLVAWIPQKLPMMSPAIAA